MTEGNSKKSVPHRCPKCIAEGSYYGLLVFPPAEAGFCPHHATTRLVPSKPERE